MLDFELLKMSMTNLLVKMVGIQLDAADAQEDLEHFYNRY